MHARIRDAMERRLPALRHNPTLKWAVGIGVFTLAFLLRWLLGDYLSGAPFITFFIALFVITLTCGGRVGAAALATSFITSWFFFVPPFLSFELDKGGAVVLSLFAIFGSVIVGVTHELNLTTERLLAQRKLSRELLERKERAEKTLTEMNQELVHRIRNIFTVAGALTAQVTRVNSTPAEIHRALAQRFEALALSQDVLVANGLKGAGLREIVDRTVHPLAPQSERVHVTGPEVFLSPQQATSLSLVLHELATNAVKYGAWSNDTGDVFIKWSVSPIEVQAVTLAWQERGGPRCTPTARVGLGTTLIERAVSGAVVMRQLLPEGLDCSLRFEVGTL